jgi:hypothetical protein
MGWIGPKCIIGVNSNGGEGKGYQNLDQTFRADFNELCFTSTALKLIKMQLNSHNVKTDSSKFPPTIIWKIRMKRAFTMRNTTPILAPRFLERHVIYLSFSGFAQRSHASGSIQRELQQIIQSLLKLYFPGPNNCTYLREWGQKL